MRSTFESGAWVEHIALQDLKGKHKRGLDRVGKPQPVFHNGEFDQEATVSGMDVMGWQAARRDAVWAMVITAWSYGLPVPQAGDDGQVDGAEAFGELPLDDLEELEELMAPFEAKLQRRPNPKAQAAAITTGSNGSSRVSGAASRMA